MGNQLQRFIDETTEGARPLERAWYLAEWEAAVNGTPQAMERTRQAQAAYMRFWSDPERYQASLRYREDKAPDPETARQIHLIYLTAAQNQQDEATIEQLTELESEVRGLYTNFRARVNGEELSDNAMDQVLATSADSGQVRQVWEASKQIGVEVADQVRQLARVRNQAARRQGFRDHFHRSLTLNEIEEDQLLSIYQSLESRVESAVRRAAGTDPLGTQPAFRRARRRAPPLAPRRPLLPESPTDGRGRLRWALRRERPGGAGQRHLRRVGYGR